MSAMPEQRDKLLQTGKPEIICGTGDSHDTVPDAAVRSGTEKSIKTCTAAWYNISVDAVIIDLSRFSRP